MTIAPVIKTMEVPLPVEEAFRLFTEGLDTWWPLDSFSIGADERAEAPVAVRFEGRVGGRVVEVMADGTEYVWAAVLAWNPPERFLLAWHPAIDPTAASILEVRFSPTEGGSALYLEHRGWEEFGERAHEMRGRYEPGWDRVLASYQAKPRSRQGLSGQ